MILTKSKLLSITVGGALLFVANLFFFDSIFVGVIGSVFYFFGLISVLKEILFKKTDSPCCWFWSSLASLFLFSILGTTVYYLYAINSWSSTIILALPITFFLAKIEPIHVKKIIFKKESPTIIFSLICFLIIEAALFITLIERRATDIMPSPWQAVGPNFFIAYLIAAGLLLFIVLKAKNNSGKYGATVLHLFLTYSVVAIIYQLGFGFDGFIHRATEVWIQNYGLITPKQPYYIGQYSLIVWLSNLTAIPIFYLDVYFVPILASLVIPGAVSQSLVSVWLIPRRYALVLLWLIPFIFFLSLNLTTPHNVLILLIFITVFAALLYVKGKLPTLPLIILALAGLAIHPLLGTPLALFTVAIILLNQARLKTKIPILILFFLIIIILLPALFSINIIVGGGELPHFINPLAKFNAFTELFKRPYWYTAYAGFFWELLYNWQRLIAPFIIFIGLLGFYLDKEKKLVHYLFPLTMIALWFGAFLLRSWIIFPGVAAFEQGDYPLRLLKTSLIFILPWSMYGLYTLYRQVIAILSPLLSPDLCRQAISNISKKIITTLFIVIISTALTISFYLSYPQRNPKVHFPGYSVSASDIKAVEWINHDNTDYNYVVLSNPVIAAAALTKYSFVKYFTTPQGEISYYSIPTGGPLFALYEKMWSRGQTREIMNEAMDIVGVKKAYFVIPSYWTKFNQIIDGAKKSADRWQIIDNGKIWVFVYYRATPR